MIKRFASLLKNELITGMVLLAPVVGTAYLVYLIVSGIDGLFPDAYRPKPFGYPMPGLGVLSVLVLALLYHDVGKWKDDDNHSAESERMIIRMCDRLNLATEDRSLGLFWELGHNRWDY